MNEQTSRLNRERRFLVLLGLICISLIGGALYMQVVLGEAPCPLCILQRYALLFIAVFAFIAAAMPGRRSLTFFEALVVLSAIGGMIAAGNHVYILANPMVSCGIDTLQPIVDDLPLAKLLAPALPFAERIALGFDSVDALRFRGRVLPGHLDRRRRDGERYENDGAQPGQHLAVHGRDLSCRCRTSARCRADSPRPA